ncbi:MAG: DUF975 family protein [Candidatus Absconditabacteria bacterium]
MKKTTSEKVHAINETPLNRGNIYKEARAYTKKNVRKFSLLLILVIVINIVNTGFDPEAQKTMSENMQLITSVLSVILSLFSAWLSMGFVMMVLRLLDNKEVVFVDGIIDLQKTFKAFVAKIITSIFSLAGFIFLIIPGIIIQTRLFFVTTLILDKNLGIWEAITTSREMTKGSVRSLIVISIITGLVQILGILTLCIGLFRTIPFMTFAETLAYRALRDRK